ncbi:MAG: hypothetical protein HY074_20065 [Deltaproteobacteria bacterium]|nr:hypothetical protein [Deltaproteobacteria bacterium]
MRKAIHDRAFQLSVGVDEDIQVVLHENLQIPINGQVTIDLDDYAQVEAEIPVQTELFISTVVETEILKFGRVKIPIKTRVPLSFTLPIKAKVKVRLDGASASIRESVSVNVPSLTIPVKTKLRTKIPFWPFG